jgi:hypothetical protein
VRQQQVAAFGLYAVRGVLRRFVTAAGIVLLFAAVVAGGLEAWLWFSRPPIVRDLSGGFFRPALADGKDVYRQRVRATFPAGIPETELLTSLAQHGYETTGAHGLGRRAAHIRGAGFPCVIEWSVQWRADSAGIVSEVEDGVYTTCL